MKAKQGKIIRAYSFAGDEGRNLFVDGQPSEIEKNYNLADTFSDEAQNDENYLGRNDVDFPDEDMVMQIASVWSIDPTTLNQRTDISPSLGLIGQKADK